MVIGRILVVFCVVKNIVTINSPTSSNPLMNFFVENSFLRKLVLDVMLGRLLEGCVFAVYNIFHVMMVVMIAVASTKGAICN